VGLHDPLRRETIFFVQRAHVLRRVLLYRRNIFPLFPQNVQRTDYGESFYKQQVSVRVNKIKYPIKRK